MGIQKRIATLLALSLLVASVAEAQSAAVSRGLRRGTKAGETLKSGSTAAQQGAAQSRAALVAKALTDGRITGAEAEAGLAADANGRANLEVIKDRQSKGLLTQDGADKMKAALLIGVLDEAEFKGCIEGLTTQEAVRRLAGIVAAGTVRLSQAGVTVASATPAVLGDATEDMKNQFGEYTGNAANYSAMAKECSIAAQLSGN